MKRIVFAGIMSLLSMGVFAQSRTVDASINLNNYSWKNISGSEDTTTFSLYLNAGYYLTDSFNIGFRGGFGKGETGNTITFGPRIKYDFYRYERIFFSLIGGLYYTRYNGSYSWNSSFQENDANRIRAVLVPSVSYSINNNIEIYWQFAELSYYYHWMTLKNTNVNCVEHQFLLTGITASPAFGLTFRF